jgi:hypothetical protein
MNVITVNGRGLETRIWDTPATLRLRISESIGVPVKWIHVIGDIQLSKIEVLTLVDLISEHLEDDKDLTVLYSENENIFPGVPIDDYIVLWYRLYKDKYGVSDINEFVQLSAIHEGKFENQINIPNDYDSFERALGRQIREERRAKDQQTRTLRDIHEVDESLLRFAEHDIPVSDFKKTAETSKIAIDYGDTDIVSIFERKSSSEVIPFISMNAPNNRVTSVFKVDNTSPIPIEWALKHADDKRKAVEAVDTIRMKVLTVPTDDSNYRTARKGIELNTLPTGREVLNIPKVFEHGLYTTVVFEELTSGKFMHVKLSSTNTVRRELIEERAIDGLDFTLGERSLSDIKGEFNVAGVDIDIDSFNLMITLDERMNSFALLDESSKLAGEKVNVQFRLYQHTDDGPKPFCNVLILQKVVGVGVSVSIGNQRLTTNSKYLTVKLSKIREEFIGSVETKLIPLILILFNIYNLSKGSYQDDILRNVKSKKVVPLRRGARTKAQSRIDILRSHAPYIFLTTTYARRRCAKDRQPTIDESDPRAMRFPIRGESKDGLQFQTHSYSCPDEKYPYPGLVRTKPEDENYDVFKFVPCCFDKDQEEIRSSPFNEYFNPEDFEVPLSGVKPAGKHIIGTSKFLSPGRDGSLPLNIEKFFSTPVLRTGVQRSMSSVIHCILMATEQDTYQMEEDNEDNVTRLRRSLRDVNVSVCSQETLNVPDLSDIHNPMVYLDPSLYYRVLEEKFNVNLVVFGFETGSSTVGTLRLPEHRPPYLSYFNDSRETVYVFEHSGSEVNRATYPQCELIVQMKKGERVARFPSDTYRLSVDILSFMTRARPWGNLVGFPNTTKQRIRNESLIASQIIDPMGKTRVFITDKMNIILFEPYPPINTERVETIEIADDTLYASEVIETVGMLFPEIQEFKKIVYENRLVGIEAVGLGVIPWVVGDEEGDSLRISDRMRYMNLQMEIFSGSEINIYDETRRQRRITDHLRQLTVFNFSKRIGGNLSRLQDKLKEFKRAGFEIEARVRDTRVFVRRLTESTLMRNGKILIPTIDVRNRLMYYLEALSYSDPRYVEFSKDQKYINYFFETSDDFDRGANESVFGDIRELYLHLQATYNYVMRPSDELVGYERVRMDGYAFRRSGVELGKTFWIQPVKDGSLARAINVVSTWNKRRINTGFYSPEVTVNVPYKTVDMTGRSDGVVSDITLLRDGDQYLAMNSID